MPPWIRRLDLTPSLMAHSGWRCARPRRLLRLAWAILDATTFDLGDAFMMAALIKDVHHLQGGCLIGKMSSWMQLARLVPIRYDHRRLVDRRKLRDLEARTAGDRYWDGRSR